MQQHQPPPTNGAPDDSSGSGTRNPPTNSPRGMLLYTGYYYTPTGQHLLPPPSAHFWYPPAPSLGYGLQQQTQSGELVPLSMGSQPWVNMQQYHNQQQLPQLCRPNGMRGVMQQWRPPPTNGAPDVFSGSHTWNPQPNSPHGTHPPIRYFGPPVSTPPPRGHYPTGTWLFPVPGPGYGFPGQVPPSLEPQPHHEVNVQQPVQLYTPNAMQGVMHAPVQWQPPLTTGATDVSSGSHTPNPYLNGPHGTYLHTGDLGPPAPPPRGLCPMFSGLLPHSPAPFLGPPVPGSGYGLQQPTQFPGQVPSPMEPQRHQASMQQPAHVPATPNTMGGIPHAPQDKDMYQQLSWPDNLRSYGRQWKDVPWPVPDKLGKMHG